MNVRIMVLVQGRRGSSERVFVKIDKLQRLMLQAPWSVLHYVSQAAGLSVVPIMWDVID